MTCGPASQAVLESLGLPGSRSPGACYLVGPLVPPVLGSFLGPILVLSSEATQTRTGKELDSFPCDRPLAFWK